MQNILIITLGNRDLQLPSNATLPISIFKHFEGGNVDTGENYVIKKNDRLFLEHSERIWDAYEICKNEVVFPMVETCLVELKAKPDKIILISTAQDPLDSQDCVYIANFLQKRLSENDYSVDFYPLRCSPVNFPKLVEVFSGLYQQWEGHQIWVGNSGGTPDMRAASYAGGFFRGIRYITLQARDKQANVTNFQAQEKLVLKHVVEKMLDNFDYSGLLNLPINDPEIKLLAEYALARLSLDFDHANEIAAQMHNPMLALPSNMGIRDKEKEVWISAKIKFQQKAWGDYLWRLFLIQDNLWIPLLENQLNGPIIHKKESNFKEWKDLIGKHPKLVKYLDNCKISNKPLRYEEPTKTVFDKIKIFYKIGTPILNEIDKIMNISMRDLRNGVAHNYRGVNREIIEKELNASNVTIEEFHKKISIHVAIKEDDFGVYAKISEKILNCF